MTQRPADCAAGNDALAHGAWEEARHAFAASLAERESPEALEGLGVAAWWLDLADIVFDSRECAYRFFLERDDRAGAARVAVWLAWDCWAFRGEHAVANGWLQRARRLAKGGAGTKSLSPGGFALMPANMNHFAYTTQETTIVLYGQGPVEFKYVNPSNDPRKASTSR